MRWLLDVLRGYSCLRRALAGRRRWFVGEHFVLTIAGLDREHRVVSPEVPSRTSKTDDAGRRWRLQRKRIRMWVDERRTDAELDHAKGHRYSSFDSPAGESDSIGRVAEIASH